MRTLPLFVLLASCSGGSDADTAAAGSGIVATIFTPKDGQEFEWDDLIELEVRVREGQETPSFRSVVWTVGNVTAKGEYATLDADRAGEGEVNVKVELAVGLEKYSDTVVVTIGGKGGDTGDDTGNDTGNDTGVVGSLNYAGSMSTHIWYDGEYGAFDADCPGTVSVNIAEDGTMSGTGWCKADGEYDFYFTIEGKQKGGGALSGDLIGEVDGNVARTPFTGTGQDGETLNASYDKTFNDSGESVRIAGTWTASPV
ncbi:MAG: hypothetical protein EXR71_13680 [Myxococcales bacterium]|nr:hypothetical protein [Myxococcales bacterium]